MHGHFRQRPELKVVGQKRLPRLGQLPANFNSLRALHAGNGEVAVATVHRQRMVGQQRQQGVMTLHQGVDGLRAGVLTRDAQQRNGALPPTAGRDAKIHLIEPSQAGKDGGGARQQDGVFGAVAVHVQCVGREDPVPPGLHGNPGAGRQHCFEVRHTFVHGRLFRPRLRALVCGTEIEDPH